MYMVDLTKHFRALIYDYDEKALLAQSTVVFAFVFSSGPFIKAVID